MAFLGAFVLYKLQIVNNDMRNEVEIQIGRRLVRGTEFDSYFKEFWSQVGRGYHANPHFSEEVFHDQTVLLDKMLKYKRDLKHKFWNATKWTFGIILVSIAVLHCIPLIKDYLSSSIMIMILAITLIALILCIVAFWQVLRFALEVDHAA